jgi:hypothetical protein
MLEIKNEQVIVQTNLPEAHKTLLLKCYRSLAKIPGYRPESDGYIVYLSHHEEPLTTLGR